MAAVTSFPTTHTAVEAVVEVLQCAIPIAKIGINDNCEICYEILLEFLDDNQIAACNKYSHTTLSIAPTLFLEFHGASEAEVQNQSETVGNNLFLCRKIFF